MNIAILGGSFDPPHKGHVAIAKRLIKLFSFDEVWLMPCFQHPFNKRLSSSSRRLKMTQLLESHKIKLSDYEIREKSISYSIETLDKLSKSYPNYKFSWIIGTDQVATFNKWKNWKKIINNYKLIIVPRSKYKKAKKELESLKGQVANSQNIIFVNIANFKPIYVSSTLVRKRLKENKPISKMLPRKVEDYIIKNNLYKN